MFDNISGARLASKRVARNHSLKASVANEIVARYAGYRDWHHLTTTVGTPDAPNGVSPFRMAEYLLSHGKSALVDAIAIDIAPEPDGDRTLIASGPGIPESINGHWSFALTGSESGRARWNVIDEVEITTLRYADYIRDPNEQPEHEDEDGWIDPEAEEDEFGVPGFMSIGAEMFAMEAVMKEAEKTIGLAVATLYLPGRHGFIDTRDLANRLFEADVGDETAMMMISQEDDFVEGGILVLESLMVDPARRGRGIARRLLGALSSEIGEDLVSLVAIDHYGVVNSQDQRRNGRAVKKLFSGSLGGMFDEDETRVLTRDDDDIVRQGDSDHIRSVQDSAYDTYSRAAKLAHERFTANPAD